MLKLFPGSEKISVLYDFFSRNVETAAFYAKNLYVMPRKPQELRNTKNKSARMSTTQAYQAKLRTSSKKGNGGREIVLEAKMRAGRY